MNYRRLLPGLGIAALLLTTALSAPAAMIQKFDLGELIENSDKVFRGVVVSKEPGSVHVGGAELSTVVYTLRVEEPIKGDFGDDKSSEVMTIEMLGSIKASETRGNALFVGGLDLNPDLSVGGDYVLFTTATSAAGLSTTVGLHQGLFRVFANAQGKEMAANGLDNSGLFNGPVEYSEFINALRANIK